MFIRLRTNHLNQSATSTSTTTTTATLCYEVKWYMWITKEPLAAKKPSKPVPSWVPSCYHLIYISSIICVCIYIYKYINISIQEMSEPPELEAPDSKCKSSHGVAVQVWYAKNNMAEPKDPLIPQHLVQHEARACCSQHLLGTLQN